MSKITFTIGGPVDSRCTKCRRITNHIVVAMEDGVPVKVQCNTCSGEHKYRPPAAAKKTAVRKPSVPKVTGQKEWQDMREKIENTNPLEYSMDSRFKVNTVIRHSAFGLGLVEAIIGPRKMEVLFEDGRKKLRCL